MTTLYHNNNISFNEINAVENFVIHTMTEVNLSESNMVHEAAAPYRAQWEYLLATEQLHEIDKVMEDMGGYALFASFL